MVGENSASNDGDRQYRYADYGRSLVGRSIVLFSPQYFSVNRIIHFSVEPFVKPTAEKNKKIGHYRNRASLPQR